MRINYFCWVAMLTVAFCSQARAGVVTGPITDPSNGYSYYLLTTDTWTNSESEAVAMGGHLATVNNSSENTWILNTFGDYGGVDRFLWIGLYDPSQDQNGGGHASNFVWVDGDPVTYTNWSIDEPNDLNGGEFWTEMFPENVARGSGYPTAPPGTWNDVPNESYPYQNNPSGNNFGPIYGVVEVVPEPTGTHDTIELSF
jgi:hypothetical protein